MGSTCAWKQSLLLGGLRFVRHGLCLSKRRRCLYYVRSIEDLVPNSFTIVVVNALTAQARPRRSDDVLLVVGEAVGVELLPDRRVPGLTLLVLVQHPLERREPAESVLPRLRWDAG